MCRKIFECVLWEDVHISPQKCLKINLYALDLLGYYTGHDLSEDIALPTIGNDLRENFLAVL